jgi:hypothetical protein
MASWTTEDLPVGRKTNGLRLGAKSVREIDASPLKPRP